jgi:hypothetical protein
LTKKEFSNWLSFKTGLCSCGDPLGVIREMARLLKNPSKAETPSEEFMLHIMDSWSLLDHGTSIYSAWLTPLGQAWVEFVDGQTDEDFEGLFGLRSDWVG